LQRRYEQLVMQHLATTDEIAAGLRALPQTSGSFAAAQAAWRFYNNPRIRLPQLAEPMIASARQAIVADCEKFVLAVHDWSGLNYSQHESKRDRIMLYHEKQFGYELQTVLILGDRRGKVLGPVYQGVCSADGVHSTRNEEPLARRTHLDEVGLTIEHVEELKLGKQLVHIIDAEADSLLHLRRFNRKKFAFVIRGSEVRRVLYQGRDVLLSEVLTTLAEKFRFSCTVDYKGKAANQYIAETEVILHRYAKLHRSRQGHRYRRYVKGKPLALRLIVSHVRDEMGNVLACWLLWTNLAEVSADTIALWYYWRWRIESYFKLLKSAGQHVEQWQQETAVALAKRLLLAAQACLVVWELARSNAPEADKARQFLVRLSGRLMKRNKPFTEPALLAGMWVLLAMLDTMECYTVDEIRQVAAFILPSLKQCNSS